MKRRIAGLIEGASGHGMVPPHALPGLPEKRVLWRVHRPFEVDCGVEPDADRGRYAARLRAAFGVPS